MWGVRKALGAADTRGRALRRAEELCQVGATTQTGEDVSLTQQRMGCAQRYGENCRGVEKSLHS
jgi:hypothetical protein